MSHKVNCSCGKSYWPNQAWMHDKCAINDNQSAKVAINKAINSSIEVTKKIVDGKSANRRDKKDYNDYMREYMRKKRAEARG